MKTPDKEWSGQKDKDRNTAERDRMRKDQDKQQQAEEQPNRQQGDWGSDQDNRRGGMGRKPGMERDRDYDPDGDRIGRKI